MNGSEKIKHKMFTVLWFRHPRTPVDVFYIICYSESIGMSVCYLLLAVKFIHYLVVIFAIYAIHRI